MKDVLFDEVDMDDADGQELLVDEGEVLEDDVDVDDVDVEQGLPEDVEVDDEAVEELQVDEVEVLLEDDADVVGWISKTCWSSKLSLKKLGG